MRKYKNIVVAILGIVLLLFSNYMGSIAPPFSISFTPILLPIFAALVLFITSYRPSIKFMLIVSMILSNDILIKFFAGGIHDWEGLSFISFYLFIGLLIIITLVVISLFNQTKENKKEFIIAFITSILFIISYLSYFETLGMDIILYPNREIEKSKESQIFIQRLNFSKNPVIIGQDTILFKNGWIEKQMRLNHRGIFKRKMATNKNNFVINLKQKGADSTHFWYQVNNDSSWSGANYLGNFISFQVDNQIRKVKLNLFHNNEMLEEILIH